MIRIDWKRSTSMKPFELICFYTMSYPFTSFLNDKQYTPLSSCGISKTSQDSVLLGSGSVQFEIRFGHQLGEKLKTIEVGAVEHDVGLPSLRGSIPTSHATGDPAWPAVPGRAGEADRQRIPSSRGGQGPRPAGPGGILPGNPQPGRVPLRRVSGRVCN